VQLRLPTDVFERIEAKAKGERRPFHRILVDELSLFPYLNLHARLGELVTDIETVLARYGSRLTVTEFDEALRDAVDKALAAQTDGRLQQQLDRLRVIRRAMHENERQASPHEDEQLVGRIGLPERQVGETGGADDGGGRRGADKKGARFRRA
jgi:hypothetical protein